MQAAAASTVSLSMAGKSLCSVMYEELGSKGRSFFAITCS